MNINTISFLSTKHTQKYSIEFIELLFWFVVILIDLINANLIKSLIYVCTYSLLLTISHKLVVMMVLKHQSITIIIMINIIVDSNPYLVNNDFYQYIFIEQLFACSVQPHTHTHKRDLPI